MLQVGRRSCEAGEGSGMEGSDVVDGIGTMRRARRFNV